MAEKRVLSMEFRDTANSSVSMTLGDPKADLTKDQVQVVMAKIIEENIFTSSAGNDLVTQIGAAIVVKTEQVLF